MPPRLSDDTLARCAARRPPYPRGAARATIVHLGLGAFARAHLAVYLDDLIAAGHHELAMVGVSLRGADVPDALDAQDGLYTLGVVRGAAVEARVIGSVLHVLHAPTQHDEVRTALAAPSTHLITMTVTEKGYCTSPATGQLDLAHPDIAHDIATPGRPTSMPGHVVLAAADRRSNGAGAVTVLSLDNIPSNGTLLRNAVMALAAATDPSLAAWIEQHMRFPCSMVDRMTPATDDAFRATIGEAIGLVDAWPVKTEPFTQWVVERAWATPMPPLADVGVTVVDDVAPWETMKLRVLNGMHTAAAHFGLRHGLDTIDQVAADRAGHGLLRRVAAEVTEVLTPPPSVDLGAYVAATLQRFANPALGHRCAQIAADTSQKLPQRLLETVRTRLARGLELDGIADALALWAWSTLGRDHTGAPRTVNDPLAAEYAAIAARHGDDPRELAAALLGIDQIFGDLAADDHLVDLVAVRLTRLLS